MKAKYIAETAAVLVAGDRDRVHGTKVKNHENIAEMWNGFLRVRRDPAAPLSAEDVALMMCCLKIARTQHGTFNADDYIDLAGYAACAGEIASVAETEDRPVMVTGDAITGLKLKEM